MLVWKTMVSVFYLSSLVEASSRRTILEIGRISTAVLVLTFTERTNPSLRLANTCETLANGHELRGVFSSTTSTISPTLTFRHLLFHFCLDCNDGRYSRIQHRQNTSARYWTCRQRRRLQLSSFENRPGGNDDPGFNSSR